MLGYGPDISVRNSQNLQMRYAQMKGLDWMISGSICGAAKILNVNHSTVLRRLAGWKKPSWRIGNPRVVSDQVVNSHKGKCRQIYG
jgi:hypothetical protein